MLLLERKESFLPKDLWFLESQINKSLCPMPGKILTSQGQELKEKLNVLYI
jgi:hypothetical protein